MTEPTELPEGTVVELFSESADSPVGGRGVVRLLQYEVHEGRERGEVNHPNRPQ